MEELACGNVEDEMYFIGLQVEEGGREEERREERKGASEDVSMRGRRLDWTCLNCRNTNGPMLRPFAD